MSIESLKEQARRHEQNEDWKKALHLYSSALAELDREDQVDIGLYNRVGDLHVRVGNLNAAVESYEKAVDLYREAYLPNNAIAVCKKIIRNVPNRHKAFLRIGQIRAEQGFLPDARTNFLTYAERMQQSGQLDESFRALIEFCDLAPDDVGVRVTVAEQMAASGRSDEAVEQLLIARQRFAHLGNQEQVEQVEAKILEVDPEADLTSVPAMVDGFGSSGIANDGEVAAEFGEITFGDAPEVPSDLSAAAEDFVKFAEEPTTPDLSASAEQEDEPADALPAMGFDDDPEDEAEPLPMMGFDDDDEAEPLPMMGFDDEPASESPAATGFQAEASPSEAAASMREAMEEASAPEAAPEPAAPEPAAPAPEPVVPAPPEPEPTITPPAHAPPAAETPAAPPPESTPGGDEGYVDLGAMILGGGSSTKSTRFTVAYEEPTGDEAADFARMLTQFKEKVTENLDSSDVRAHYDLGTAYKEMGLLDEAISAFQAALRASANHLPTYELMGQTFIEMGQPEAAVKSLRRALQANAGVEDELVGIYYYLARAYEELQDRESAVEFYDRVFSLDINFADVTERLRELR